MTPNEIADRIDPLEMPQCQIGPNGDYLVNGKELREASDLIRHQAARIVELEQQAAVARAGAIEEVVQAIAQQIAAQRNMTKGISDRREKELDAARLVGMGDAVLIARAVLASLTTPPSAAVGEE